MTPSFGLDDATLPNPVATTNATRTYTLNVTDIISGCAPVIKSVVVTVNPSLRHTMLQVQILLLWNSGYNTDIEWFPGRGRITSFI